MNTVRLKLLYQNDPLSHLVSYTYPIIDEVTRIQHFSVRGFFHNKNIFIVIEIFKITECISWDSLLSLEYFLIPQYMETDEEVECWKDIFSFSNLFDLIYFSDNKYTNIYSCIESFFIKIDIHWGITFMNYLRIYMERSSLPSNGFVRKHFLTQFEDKININTYVNLYDFSEIETSTIYTHSTYCIIYSETVDDLILYLQINNKLINTFIYKLNNTWTVDQQPKWNILDPNCIVLVEWYECNNYKIKTFSSHQPAHLSSNGLQFECTTYHESKYKTEQLIKYLNIYIQISFDQYEPILHKFVVNPLYKTIPIIENGSLTYMRCITNISHNHICNLYTHLQYIYSVRIIQKYWKISISNPQFKLCRKRLVYEFEHFNELN
jgi:hypothetical protein